MCRQNYKSIDFDNGEQISKSEVDFLFVHVCRTIRQAQSQVHFVSVQENSNIFGCRSSIIHEISLFLNIFVCKLWPQSNESVQIHTKRSQLPISL